MKNEWDLTSLAGQAGFDEIRREWLSMVEADDASTYLQHPDWIASYLEALAPDAHRVRFLCARKNGRLRAILPVELHRRHAWPMPQIYTLINGPHMHLSELCVASHDAEAREAFFKLMLTDAPQHWLRLQSHSVHEGSNLHRALDAANLQSISLTAPKGQTTWMDCSAGIDQCLARVSKSFKQNIRRLARRAEGMGTVEYHAVTCPERLEWALQEFLRVEGSGWKTQAGTDIAHDPKLVAFYRALTRRFSSRGACRINLLMLNGQTIAGQFGLLSARQLNLLKIGYNADFASIAPGNLIMQRTLETVCDDPAVDRLSFVTNPPWAHLWKPHLVAIQDVSLFHPGVLGQSALKGIGWWRARQQRRQASAAQAAAEANVDSPSADSPADEESRAAPPREASSIDLPHVHRAA